MRMTLAVVALAAVGLVSGCRDKGQAPANQEPQAVGVTRVYFPCERTGGVMGGTSERLELVYPADGVETPSAEAVVLTKGQAEEVARILEDAGVMEWEDVPYPAGWADLFVYDITVRIDEGTHAVHATDLPDRAEYRQRIEGLVKKLRAAAKQAGGE